MYVIKTYLFFYNNSLEECYDFTSAKKTYLNIYKKFLPSNSYLSFVRNINSLNLQLDEWKWMIDGKGFSQYIFCKAELTLVNLFYKIKNKYYQELDLILQKNNLQNCLFQNIIFGENNENDFKNYIKSVYH